MLNYIKKVAKSGPMGNKLIYAGFCASAVFLAIAYILMRIHPVERKKIVFSSTKGKFYGDNPKYITDALLKYYPGEFDIVWLLNSDCKAELPEGVRRVPYGGLAMIRELATAGVWVDSQLKSFGTLKRRKQYFIQTWHGNYGLKKLYYDLPGDTNRIDIKNIEWNSKIENLLLSNSRKTTQIYRSSMHYTHKIMECGSPRNDIFFEEEAKQEIMQRVREYFKTGDKKLALYAPTFRDDLEIEALNIDYTKLKAALEARFGGEWAVLVRLHPHNKDKADKAIRYSDTVLNVSDYNLMQELLVACDVLVTDYSSCMFDFITVPKPCFIYASDLDKYNNERGFYYDLYDLPFPVATDNDQLFENIKDFDETGYYQNVRELFRMVGLKDRGTACVKAAEHIKKVVEYRNDR